MESEIKELIEIIKPLITKNGILQSGNGIICNNTEETNKILNKMNNTLMHLENKVENLMDEKSQERHEQIKRRFNKY